VKVGTTDGEVEIDDKPQGDAWDVETVTATLADVGGMQSVKDRLTMAFLAPLRNPEIRKLYGKSLSGGLLLYGPPGCGKTYIARALAGEVGAAFMNVRISDVLGHYIGDSENNLHDVFETARACAPVVLFLDEIDAVGMRRSPSSASYMRPITNQLLMEMDGIGADNEGLFILAATNTPWDVDPALRRPGRFDRSVAVLPPDAPARHSILYHYLKDRPMEGIDLGVLVRQTSGFTGADLANVLNEAALLTARSNAHLIDNRALDEAIDRVIAGPQKRTRVMRDHEKRVTAYHEAGHALCAAAGAYSDPVTKVTILPRGRALGYTQVMPQDDKYSTTRNELLDQLVYAMGGRAAEEIIFRDPTTGASNDIEKATATARKMVTDYGMTSAVGAVKLGTTESETVLGLNATSRDFSEEVAATVDAEVRNLLDTAHREAWEILTRNRAVLDQLAEELLTRETLLEKDLERIFEGVIKQPERPLWRSDESLPVVEAAPAPVGESDDSHGSDDFWGYNH